jgi:hypothetical protein
VIYGDNVPDVEKIKTRTAPKAEELDNRISIGKMNVTNFVV